MVPQAQKEEDDSNVEENKIRSHKKSRPSPSRSSNKEFKAHDNRVTIQDTSDHNHTSAMRTGAHYHLHRGNTWFTNVFDHDFNTTHHSKKPESSNGSQDLRVESRDKISNKTSAYSKKPKVGAITSSQKSVTSLNVKENKAKITYDDDGDKKINQYRVITLLGQGAFGKVKLVESEEDGQQYAMKIQSKKKMKKVALKTGKDSFNLLQKETAIMKKICHPNLIQLIEIIDDPEKGKLYFIMDYMNLGFLGSSQHMSHINNSEKYLPDNYLLKYFRDCIQGIDYLHNVARVIHFDIKPENILVNKDDVIKIADFGISQMMNKSEEFRKVGGTKMFLPPETWKERKYKGKPIDIWALGITFYFLAVGYYPFKVNDMSKFNKIVEETKIEFPDRIHPLLVDLLSKMTQKKPEDRIKLEEIMVHPWVTQKGLKPLPRIDTKQCEVGLRVTKEDIKNAMTINKLEMNLFALSKMHIKFSRKKTQADNNKHPKKNSLPSQLIKMVPKSYFNSSKMVKLPQKYNGSIKKDDNDEDEF